MWCNPGQIYGEISVYCIHRSRNLERNHWILKIANDKFWSNHFFLPAVSIQNSSFIYMAIFFTIFFWSIKKQLLSIERALHLVDESFFLIFNTKSFNSVVNYANKSSHNLINLLASWLKSFNNAFLTANISKSKNVLYLFFWKRKCIQQP